MTWSAAFTDLPPIKLPDGRTLKTLADCRAYILALPKREQELQQPASSLATALKQIDNQPDAEHDRAGRDGGGADSKVIKR